MFPKVTIFIPEPLSIIPVYRVHRPFACTHLFWNGTCSECGAIEGSQDAQELYDAVPSLGETKEGKSMNNKQVVGIFEERRCPSCHLTAAEQEKQKTGRMAGLCGPGRCVVNETAWLVMPSTGEPLTGTFPEETQKG